MLVVENSGGGSTATVAPVNLGNEGGDGSVSGEFEGGGGERVSGEEGDRNSAGNRWPREETLALLQVRSGMDVAFRDSTVKAPLWDEVSRKLAEFGYQRSAKKCREKFENIYKYHRRTKEGRSRRQNGKNYRFFEQLELFDSQPSIPSPPINKINQTFMSEQTMPMPNMMTNPVMMVKPINQISQDDFVTPSLTQNTSFELMSTSTSTESSGKESERNVKKKRKLVDYFDGLMKVVLERQENLQNKFIEAIEKCEKDRMAREEEWKVQQIARKKKEQEILAHERAVSAAKDAAVISFLQRISEQPGSVQLPEKPSPLEKILNMNEFSIGESLPTEKSTSDTSIQVASSRWPKAEVEALIRIKENLDLQYNDNGPKGPLWEEISSAMKKLGYDRSSKRCKEKWENINKYYRRVKESNKKRPEDSKTCLYFHMLDSLYKRKSKVVDTSTSDSSGCNLKPEDILMQMIGHHQQQVVQQSVRENGESENVDQTPEGDGDGDEDEEEDEDDDENEDDYHIVANNTSSVAIME